MHTGYFRHLINFLISFVLRMPTTENTNTLHGNITGSCWICFEIYHEIGLIKRNVDIHSYQNLLPTRHYINHNQYTNAYIECKVCVPELFSRYDSIQTLIEL